MTTTELTRMRLAAECEEPVREVCPDCNGLKNEHDPSSGPWLWCPTCNHRGVLFHYPQRAAYQAALIEHVPALIARLEYLEEQATRHSPSDCEDLGPLSHWHEG